MADAIDFARYGQLPVFDKAGGRALVRALVAAAPKGLPAKAKKTLLLMKEADAALAEHWRDSEDLVADARRPADQAVDHAWGAFFERVRVHSEMPAARVPLVEEAKDVMGKIFPTGLQFLKLPFVEEWAESERRLERIREDGLERVIDRIAGPEYLAEVRFCHDVYGKVLGITDREEAKAAGPAGPGGLDRLRDVRKAMNRYVLNLLAIADDDPETEALVRVALAPIDEFRAQAAVRRNRAGAEDDTPEAPVAPQPGVAPGAAPFAGAAPAAPVDGAPHA